MKRPLRRFEVICLAVALGGGGACTPDNSVKPGAPVLTQVSIVEGGGASITSIPAGAVACTADVTAGGACYTTAPMCTQPMAVWCRCVPQAAPSAPTAAPACDAGASGAAGGAAGGTADGGAGAGGAGGAAGSTADASADAPPPPDGTWNCDPFSPTAQVLFVFDRLLDPRPLDPGDGGTTVMAATVVASGLPIASNGDYTSNGSPGELIFPAYGDFRAGGPDILVSGVPAFPASSPITVTLNPANVRAKDGHTPFTDDGNFNGGSLSFATAPFAASITPPAPPPLPADAGACATPNTLVALDATATITFTAAVDPGALQQFVSVTAGGTAVPFTLMTMDNLNVTLAPVDKWPANSTITITVDGKATDLAGDMLGMGAPAPQDFMTGAN